MNEARNRKMAGRQFWEKKSSRLDLNESREGFCRRGRGRSFLVDGVKQKKAREPTVESLVRGIWRLRVSEAERRAREKLKTVTDIIWSSARNTLVADSIYLALNSLLDWKSLEKLKQV